LRKFVVPGALALLGLTLTVLAAGPAHAADPVGQSTRAFLYSDDGSSVTLPVTTSIVSETLNGVTTWRETQSVGVPAALLGLDPVGIPADLPVDEIAPPGAPDGLLTPPNPLDLLPPTDDPTAPVTGNDASVDTTTSAYTKSCEPDGSDSVTSCLTMNYSSYTKGSNHRYVKLISYVHQWIRADNTVRWSGALARAAVYGYTPNNGYVGRVEDWKLGSPAGGATYTQRPSWVGVDIDVMGYGHGQGSNNEIKLQRGTRTWTLLHSNVQQGNISSF
jgi:hypothetical protein